MSAASVPHPNRFHSELVQAGRGLAAIAVVFYHASSMYSLPKYGGRVVWAAWGEAGKHGVDFFFVLSGFIILSAHQADIGQIARLRRYAARRFVRIYPVYWFYLSVFLALAAVGLSNAPIAHSPANLVTAYSLIRLTSDNPPLWVAWTLFHEMVFYGLFATLIASRRYGIAAMAAWLMLIVIMHASPGPDYPTFFSVIYDGLNVEFFLGILVAMTFRSLNEGSAWALVGVGSVGLVAAAAGQHYYAPNVVTGLYTLTYGLAFAAILAGVVALEMLGKLRSNRMLSWFGSATFSIYLAHSMVISIVYRYAALIFKPGSQASEFLPMIVAIVAVCVCTPLFWVIEKPIIDFFRKRLEPRKTADAQPAIA